MVSDEVVSVLLPGRPFLVNLEFVACGLGGLGFGLSVVVIVTELGCLGLRLVASGIIGMPAWEGLSVCIRGGRDGPDGAETYEAGLKSSYLGAYKMPSISTRIWGWTRSRTARRILERCSTRARRLPELALIMEDTSSGEATRTRMFAWISFGSPSNEVNCPMIDGDGNGARLPRIVVIIVLVAVDEGGRWKVERMRLSVREH